ncbi:MAG: GTP cyclohydrolase I FolE [Actinobacteria bacterium]|nr:MAG: GTP cyclohydrolase I FolE [Actinomycetota bacterium]
MDREKIEQGVKLILKGLGEDLQREGLVDTPRRVAKMYEEIFKGYTEPVEKVISVQFSENHDEMVLVKDIPFYSVCEHHLLPFIGKAHVAYIPGKQGKITGISKLARVVDIVARRLQVQERLTTKIADVLTKTLKPRGVIVIIEAEHLCMSMRGVGKPGHKTVTSAVRGIFRTSQATRAEAMTIIGAQ